MCAACIPQKQNRMVCPTKRILIDSISCLDGMDITVKSCRKKCSAHVARLCIQLRDTLKKENGMKKSGTAIAVPLLILNVTIVEQHKGRKETVSAFIGEL